MHTESTSCQSYSNCFYYVVLPVLFMAVSHSLWVGAELLTLGEAWRVVIDVSEPDSDGGGPR